MRFLTTNNNKMAKHHQEKLDVNKLHDEAMIRHSQTKSETKPHGKFDINVKKSYYQSMQAIEDAFDLEEIDEDTRALRMEHLNSVISAGACKYA